MVVLPCAGVAWDEMTAMSRSGYGSDFDGKLRFRKEKRSARPTGELQRKRLALRMRATAATAAVPSNRSVHAADCTLHDHHWTNIGIRVRQPSWLRHRPGEDRCQVAASWSGVGFLCGRWHHALPVRRGLDCTMGCFVHRARRLPLRPSAGRGRIGTRGRTGSARRT